MPKKNIGPRISRGASEFYSSRFSSLNAGTEYALEAFPVLYRRTMSSLTGIFASDELIGIVLLMLNAHKRNPLTSQVAGQYLVNECADAFILEGFVAGADFMARLQSLTFFDVACLEIWSRAFWESGKHDEDLAAYVEPLAR